MNHPVSSQVVYLMEVADRPGIMHSIASVFAHRGLSIDCLVADTGRKPTRIVIVFGGTPRQQQWVEQVLARLHHVDRLRVLPATSPELRGVAFCRVHGALPAVADVVVQLDAGRALLSGPYAAVEAALAQWISDGRVTEVSRSLVAL